MNSTCFVAVQEWREGVVVGGCGGGVVVGGGGVAEGVVGGWVAKAVGRGGGVCVY